MKCHMSLTLLLSILLRQQMTIPTMYYTLLIYTDDLILPMNTSWCCNKFSWVGTQPSKPQSTITPWFLKMKNPSHCSVEHLEWLSPHKGQQISGTFCNGTMCHCEQGHSSFGTKDWSNMFLKQQQAGRVLTYLEGSCKPSRSPWP